MARGARFANRNCFSGLPATNGSSAKNASVSHDYKQKPRRFLAGVPRLTSNLMRRNQKFRWTRKFTLTAGGFARAADGVTLPAVAPLNR